MIKYTDILKEQKGINKIVSVNNSAQLEAESSALEEYNNGYIDGYEGSKRACYCEDCPYCEGYDEGVEDVNSRSEYCDEEEECDRDDCECCENSEFCQGQHDANEGYDRECHCDGCNYCRGYNDAMSI